MAKQYQVVINQGKGPQNDGVEVTQGAGDQGRAVRVMAQQGVRYELQDLGKGKALAPDHVRVKRAGSHLNLMFDNSQAPDVVFENYYAFEGPSNSASPPMLAGCLDNGACYEYVPHDPARTHMTAALKDSETPVMMSLGGGPLSEGGFALAGLAVASAAAAAGGGIGVLGTVGAVALVASAAGGGGGGGAAPVAPPSKATGALAAESDTGFSNQDGVTQAVTPFYTGKAAPDSKIEVVVNGATYLDKAGPDGLYKVAIKNALPAGVYTPKITVTDEKTDLSTTSDGTPFTVDDSGSTNPPGGVADDNVAATVQITSIRGDTGTSASDFITQDNTLVYEGRVDKFVRNGDVVKLVLKNAAGEVLSTQHVVPGATGTWTWDNTTTPQNDGRYTLTALLVDAAGNAVTPDSAVASQVILISQQSLVGVDDTALAVEAGVSSPTGTSATGNVLTNDTVVDPADLKKAVVATMTGTYGVFSVAENGDYTYVVDNANTQVNALRGSTSAHAADTLTDAFTYQVTDAAGQVASAKVLVTLQGTNDAPSITGTTTATLRASDASDFVEGQLNIADPDLGESLFQIPSQLNGAYGAFTFNGNGNGKWTYTLGSNQTFTDSRHELLTVASLDGSRFETIDVWINKNVDPQTGALLDTTQTFSTATPVGLSLLGKANETQDTLLLSGAGLTLDMTAATTRVKSIEKIDLTGTGNNQVVLNLDSVLQADPVGGLHKLYILGNAGDTAQIKGSISAVDSTSVLGYNLYHVNSSNDLLVQKAVNVVVL